MVAGRVWAGKALPASTLGVSVPMPRPGEKTAGGRGFDSSDTLNREMRCMRRSGTGSGVPQGVAQHACGHVHHRNDALVSHARGPDDPEHARDTAVHRVG